MCPITLNQKPAGSLRGCRPTQNLWQTHCSPTTVSLLVQSGEVVGLLGPKTGLVKPLGFYMIVGIVPADART